MIIKATVRWEKEVTINVEDKFSATTIKNLLINDALHSIDVFEAKIVKCIEKPEVVDK